MSQIVSLDQADFCQPEVVYNEMTSVDNVITSIRSLTHNIEKLKATYQQSPTKVNFSLNEQP